MKIWVNDGLYDHDDMALSALDHGITVGDGVFETLRVYDGSPFEFERHVARLARSADGLGLATPDGSALRRATVAVLAANDLRDARLRWTVTGGIGPLGSARDPEARPTTIVAATDPGVVDPWADVVTVAWPRNERGALTGLKTTSYGENVRALAFAQARGGSEAIFANTRGELCEGSGSNVFVVSGDTVRTPPLSAGCLDGIARFGVFEVAASAGVAVVEATLEISELADADEAFLTSSVREIQPIRAVDGRRLPGAPGPITLALREAFGARIRAETRERLR